MGSGRTITKRSPLPTARVSREEMLLSGEGAKLIDALPMAPWLYLGVVLKVLVKKGPLGIHFLKRGS